MPHDDLASKAKSTKKNEDDDSQERTATTSTDGTESEMRTVKKTKKQKKKKTRLHSNQEKRSKKREKGHRQQDESQATVQTVTSTKDQDGGGTDDELLRRPSRQTMEWVTKQDYYHGFRSRDAATAMVPNVGDWLLRESDPAGDTRLLLTVRMPNNKVESLTVVEGTEGFSLLCNGKKMQDRVFPTIADIITRYAAEGPKQKLKRPVTRPSYYIDPARVTKDELLGEGCYGQVFRGRYQDNTGKEEIVALKVVKPPQHADAKKLDAIRKERAKMVDEGAFMQRISHDNLVKFIGIVFSPPVAMLVLEFCPGGSLAKHLRTMNKEISIEERILYLIEAGIGLEFLHMQRVVHCDIASRNCLIDAKGTVKIADFGLSRSMTEVGELTLPDKVNFAIRWMAPEVVAPKAAMRHFSFASDVWSYACLAYEIFMDGNPPFHPREQFSNSDVLRRIRQGIMPGIPATTPPTIAEVLRMCWVKEEKDRLSIFDVLRLLVIRSEQEKLLPPSIDGLTLNKIPHVKRVASVAEVIKRHEMVQAQDRKAQCDLERRLKNQRNIRPAECPEPQIRPTDEVAVEVEDGKQKKPTATTTTTKKSEMGSAVKKGTAEDDESADRTDTRSIKQEPNTSMGTRIEAVSQKTTSQGSVPPAKNQGERSPADKKNPKSSSSSSDWESKKHCSP